MKRIAAILECAAEQGFVSRRDLFRLAREFEAERPGTAAEAWLADRLASGATVADVRHAFEQSRFRCAACGHIASGADFSTHPVLVCRECGSPKLAAHAPPTDTGASTHSAGSEDGDANGASRPAVGRTLGSSDAWETESLAGCAYLVRRGTTYAGEAYSARDRHSRAPVWLHVLSAAYLAQRPADLIETKRSLRQVVHPALESVWRVESLLDRRVAVVAQPRRGRTLAEWAGRDGLEPRDVAALGLTLASALGSVHAAGHVHGNVTPWTVRLESDRGTRRTSRVGHTRRDLPRTVLVDAALPPIHPCSPDIARAGSILGDPSTVAPECIGGQPATNAADVYALGVTLVHALAGRGPFATTSRDDLLLAHVAQAPELSFLYEQRFVDETEEAVVARLAALLGDMLAKRPTARPGGMDEVAEALRQCVTPAATGHFVRPPAAVAQPPLESERGPATPADASATPSTAHIADHRDTAHGNLRPPLLAGMATDAASPFEARNRTYAPDTPPAAVMDGSAGADPPPNGRAADSGHERPARETQGFAGWNSSAAGMSPVPARADRQRQRRRFAPSAVRWAAAVLIGGALVVGGAALSNRNGDTADSGGDLVGAASEVEPAGTQDDSPRGESPEGPDGRRPERVAPALEPGVGAVDPNEPSGASPSAIDEPQASPAEDVEAGSSDRNSSFDPRRWLPGGERVEQPEDSQPIDRSDDDSGAGPDDPGDGSASSGRPQDVLDALRHLFADPTDADAFEEGLSLAMQHLANERVADLLVNEVFREHAEALSPSQRLALVQVMRHSDAPAVRALLRDVAATDADVVMRAGVLAALHRIYIRLGPPPPADAAAYAPMLQENLSHPNAEVRLWALRLVEALDSAGLLRESLATLAAPESGEPRGIRELARTLLADLPNDPSDEVTNFLREVQLAWDSVDPALASALHNDRDPRRNWVAVGPAFERANRRLDLLLALFGTEHILQRLERRFPTATRGELLAYRADSDELWRRATEPGRTVNADTLNAFWHRIVREIEERVHALTGPRDTYDWPSRWARIVETNGSTDRAPFADPSVPLAALPHLDPAQWPAADPTLLRPVETPGARVRPLRVYVTPYAAAAVAAALDGFRRRHPSVPIADPAVVSSPEAARRIVSRTDAVALMIGEQPDIVPLEDGQRRLVHQTPLGWVGVVVAGQPEFVRALNTLGFREVGEILRREPVGDAATTLLLPHANSALGAFVGRFVLDHDTPNARHLVDGDDPVGVERRIVEQLRRDDDERRLGMLALLPVEARDERNGLSYVPVDGVPPSTARIRAGHYPLAQRLLLVRPSNMESDAWGASSPANVFATYLMSEEGQRLLREGGVLPLRPAGFEADFTQGRHLLPNRQLRFDPPYWTHTRSGNARLHILTTAEAEGLASNVGRALQTAYRGLGVVLTPFERQLDTLLAAEARLDSDTPRQRDRVLVTTRRLAEGHRYHAHLVAHQALAVVVNADNPLQALTFEELQRVYDRRIRRWSALGERPPAEEADEIHLFGSTLAWQAAMFQERVLRTSPQPERGQGITYADAAEILRQIAGEQPRGIGFVPLQALAAAPADVRERIRAVRLRDFDLDTPPVAPTEAAVRNGLYPLARPLYLYTDGPVAPGSPTAWLLEFWQSRLGQGIVADMGRGGFVDLYGPAQFEPIRRGNHVLMPRVDRPRLAAEIERYVRQDRLLPGRREAVPVIGSNDAGLPDDSLLVRRGLAAGHAIVAVNGNQVFNRTMLLNELNRDDEYRFVLVVRTGEDESTVRELVWEFR